MYIHLGSDEMIQAKDIIAILNIEPPIPDALKEIIDMGYVDKNIRPICERGRAKSLVITPEQLYLSPISSVTLYRRSYIQFREG
ncbi:MAG: extracellular matrix regulator RemB [Solirubrobacterales bacterium]